MPPSEVNITGILDHPDHRRMRSKTPSPPPPEQSPLEHHDIWDIALHEGDTLQAVRGGFHFMPVTRQVLPGDFKKCLVSVRNEYSHSPLPSFAAMWPRSVAVRHPGSPSFHSSIRLHRAVESDYPAQADSR